MRSRRGVSGDPRRRAREGSVVIAVAVSIVALFAFAIVAIDGAILMTAKTQLQNAADTAALAGDVEEDGQLETGYVRLFGN